MAAPGRSRDSDIYWPNGLTIVTWRSRSCTWPTPSSASSTTPTGRLLLRCKSQLWALPLPSGPPVPAGRLVDPSQLRPVVLHLKPWGLRHAGLLRTGDCNGAHTASDIPPEQGLGGTCIDFMAKYRWFILSGMEKAIKSPVSTSRFGHQSIVKFQSF